MPLESLVEVQGNYVKDLAPERLEALRRLFPEVDLETEGLKLVHEVRETARWFEKGCFEKAVPVSSFCRVTASQHRSNMRPSLHPQ